MSAPPLPESAARLRAVLAADRCYWSRGPQRRFARRAWVSESALSRLLCGAVADPGFSLVCRITAQVERNLGRRVDPRQLFGGAAGGTPLAPLEPAAYAVPEAGGQEPARAVSGEAAAKAALHWREKFGVELTPKQAKRLVAQSLECLKALAG